MSPIDFEEPPPPEPLEEECEEPPEEKPLTRPLPRCWPSPPDPPGVSSLPEELPIVGSEEEEELDELLLDEFETPELPMPAVVGIVTDVEAFPVNPPRPRSLWLP